VLYALNGLCYVLCENPKGAPLISAHPFVNKLYMFICGIIGNVF